MINPDLTTLTFDGYADVIERLGSTVEEMYKPRDTTEVKLYGMYGTELRPLRDFINDYIRELPGVTNVEVTYPLPVKVVGVSFDPTKTTEAAVADRTYRAFTQVALDVGISDLTPSEYSSSSTAPVSSHKLGASIIIGLFLLGVLTLVCMVAAFLVFIF